MSRRTQLFPILPWEGGLNDSSDSAMIPPTDLTIADNIIYTTSKSKKKRSGRSYIGTPIPNVINRSSSGTTRTIVFDSSINISSPLDQILVIGEKISIASSGSGNDPSYVVSDVAILSITTTSITNDTITYTGGSSLSESSTPTSTLVLTRSSTVLCLKDYWYLDSSNLKAQYLMMGTSQGKFFRYDSNGRRKEIIKDTSAAHNFSDSDVNTGSDVITISTHGYVNGIKGQLTSSGTLPAGLSLATDYFIIKTGTNTLKLAVSYQDSISGIAVDITSAMGGGTHTFTPSSATSITVPLTLVNMNVYNNKLIISLSGLGNTPKIYDPLIDDEWIDLPGTPPDFSIAREHYGRLFVNQKDNPDRLHYCETFNHTIWNGLGDSGATDSSPGDGDPKGISAIGIPFKGDLYITKKGKAYRLIGQTPEEFYLDPISEGIGTDSHNSFVAVDEDDMFFVSPRGVHSVIATANHGSFESEFISKDIQRTYNTFSKGDLSKCSGAWIPTINSVAYLFTERDNSKSIYLVNVYEPDRKKWYRWPDTSATCIADYEIDDEKKLIFGTSNGLIIEAENNNNFDFTSMPIRYRVKTGTIYPDNDPIGNKAFKSISFLYRPTGNFSFTATLKIDNLPTQSYFFSQTSGTDLLGSTFILGSSILGTSETFNPFTTTIDGYGRGITIQIDQNGIDESIEIYGIIIEWETAGLIQEVV